MSILIVITKPKVLESIVCFDGSSKLYILSDRVPNSQKYIPPYALSGFQGYPPHVHTEGFEFAAFLGYEDRES